jgi:hypothetical protein
MKAHSPIHNNHVDNKLANVHKGKKILLIKTVPLLYHSFELLSSLIYS